jgi:hypothetical protein
MGCLIAFNMLARFGYLLCSQLVARSRRGDMMLKASRSNPKGFGELRLGKNDFSPPPQRREFGKCFLDDPRNDLGKTAQTILVREPCRPPFKVARSATSRPPILPGWETKYTVNDVSLTNVMMDTPASSTNQTNQIWPSDLI